MGPAWREVCTACRRTWDLGDRRWRCTCGGLLDLVGPLAPHPLPAEERTLVRYAAALPPGAGRVDLGLVAAPLEEAAPGVWVKSEFRHPTGSFKDRGAAVMLGVALEVGVDSVVVDSSGNAGKSAAAHAEAAGLACRVFVPEGTAPAKVTAMSAHGAQVVEVPGGRTAATVAAQEEVERSGRWYASHVHQPAFHHGVKTLAFELADQLAAGGLPGGAPGSVVVPAGNGTLVLGLWLGFEELIARRVIQRRPAIVAVQAERCAPLLGRPPTADGRPVTEAAGIAVPDPPRADQVRACVAASGGRLLAVGEGSIRAARDELGDLGYPVEATGAVGWAALEDGPELARPVVVVLTG